MDLQCQGVLDKLEEGCESFVRGGLCNQPLPESAWRCQPRPLAQAEDRGLHPETWKMGSGLKREDLRQAWEAAADGEQACEMGRLWRKGQTELPCLLPQWYLPAAAGPTGQSLASLCGKNFLSLFGGAAEIAKAFARRGGQSAVIDLIHSASNDLSKSKHWNSVCSKVHFFSLVGIDIPCNTWSCARRAPRGSRMPQPLRGDSEEHIMGLPGLLPTDREKVLKANRMLYGARKLVKKCLKLGIPGYLENPLTSRIWKSKIVKRLLQDPRVHFIKTHMCMYGTQWRKATGLLVWNVQPFDMLKCHGRHACDRTGRKHLQLTGVSEAKFVTEQAQVYPQRFAEALLDGFLASKSLILC